MGIVRNPLEAAPRPSADSRLKMHLRLLTLGGYTFRVVTLRPGTRVAFSTNFFHQTWHIVTSPMGARLLGRLLWGLSYERHPGTLVLIHGDHLLPTPFEAERSDPFLLVPAGITRLDPSALRILKGRLSRLGPSHRTIRWHTFGLDAASQARQDGRGERTRVEVENESLRWGENGHLWRRERMERRGGFICYSAPPAVLRQQALRVHSLKVRKGSDTAQMDYHFLAEDSSKGSWCGGGEVQIFADYMDRVAAAGQARREILPNPEQAVIDWTVQVAISRLRDHLKGLRTRQRSFPRQRCHKRR